MRTSCEEAGKDCGTLEDGCGGTLECGACPDGEHCGGGGEANVCGLPGTCSPISCEAAGKNCGTISDGCGGTLECGTCSDGESCAADNVCQASEACHPVSCEELGKNCGTISDGCGGTLECGTCSANKVCGGGGTPNVCGGYRCVPTTCEAEGKTCGEIYDGCGGLVLCGSCAPGETCADDQVTCQPALREPEVRWLRISPGLLGTLAVADGRLVAGDGGLRGLDAEGQDTWSAAAPQPDVGYGELIPTFDGQGLLALGRGPCFMCGGLVDAFSSTGVHWKRHQESIPDVSASELSALPNGGYVYLEHASIHGPSKVVIVDEGGERRTFGPPLAVDGTQFDSSRFTALTSDASGSVIVAVALHEQVTFLGETLGRANGWSTALLKLTANGTLAWVRPFETGEIKDLAASGTGSILALTSGLRAVETAQVGGTQLLSLSPDGTTQWARPLPGGLPWHDDKDLLAILPSGESVVLTSRAHQAWWISRFGPDGTPQWIHSISGEGAYPGDFEVNLTSVTLFDGEAILSGYFNGAITFGRGHRAETPDTRFQGFLLNLGR